LSIEDLYQKMLLAEAAYIDLPPVPITLEALRNRGMGNRGADPLLSHLEKQDSPESWGFSIQ